MIFTLKTVALGYNYKKGRTMKNFWKYAFYRALRTVCQSAIALIPASALITEVDWLLVASASVLAGIVSILTSIATGLPEVEYENHLYQYYDEPADSEVEDDNE